MLSSLVFLSIHFQHTDPRAVAGFSDAEERHFPQHGPGTHLSNGSGGMAVPVEVDGEAAPLHQEEGVGDLALFNQNGIRVRAEKLGFQQLQMGLEQRPQPAVDRFRLLCCGIHSGQATTPILIGTGLIP